MIIGVGIRRVSSSSKSPVFGIKKQASLEAKKKKKKVKT